MRPSRHLPAELCDLIFAYISQDTQSLSQCSVVCKLWRSRARRHLFHTIYLLFKSTSATVEILLNLRTSPDVRWVRNVVIRNSLLPINTSLLIACLEPLPDLDALVFENVQLHCDGTTTRPHLRVKTLELIHVTPSKSCSIMDLVSVFATIGTFVTHGEHSWYIHYAPKKIEECRPCSSRVDKPTVESFSASKTCSFENAQWLYNILRVYTSDSSLTSLNLAYIPTTQHQSLRDWFQTNASQITSISLDLSSAHSLLSPSHLVDPNSSPPIDLQHLNVLNSLVLFAGISHLVNGGKIRRKTVWETLLAIIQTASTGLSYLTIGFMTRGDLSWCLGELDWEGFDRAIARFEGLKVLSFSRRFDDFSGEEICAIRKCVEKLSMYRHVTIAFRRD